MCEHAWVFVTDLAGGRDICCARCGVTLDSAARQQSVRSRICAHAWTIVRPGAWWHVRCTRCGADVARREQPEGSGRWSADIRWPEGTQHPLQHDPVMEQAATYVEVLATQWSAEQAVQHWEREHGG
jgi:hypothetical protein